MKDEQIVFLRANNRRIQEFHNSQVKTFLERISQLEDERDKFMRRGPNKDEIKQLQESNKQLKTDSDSCMAELTYKETVIAEDKMTKSNLVASVTNWNKKYADCMRDSRDHKREVSARIAQLEQAATNGSDVSAAEVDALREQVAEKEAEVGNLLKDLAKKREAMNIK